MALTFDWRTDIHAPNDLVGPVEISAWLGVRPNTVHVWVARQLMPAPWATVSGTRIWVWADVEEWATATGRAPADDRGEAF